jgi:hypothetical protein
MESIWKRLREMEIEERRESKGDPQLETLEILKEIADSEKERIVSKSSEDRIEVPAVSSEEVFSHGEESKPSLILVANLANRIKKTMGEIRGLTESSQGRFKDLTFGQEFHRRMIEHIDNSEADLNCFLDYLRIKSPVRQPNMIHVVLEEALEKHKKKLMDKRIKVAKKQFEKELPNASVHIEELRFILNWILGYAIISAAPNQSIAFLTRSLEAQEANEAIGSPQQRKAKCVEIVIASGHYQDSNKQLGVPPKINTAYNEGERSWILPLVDEIVQKNQGILKLSEGHLRMVSLILPIERRKIVYYERGIQS